MRSEDYDPHNEKVVARARSVPDEKRNELPVESLPAGTALEANEKTLKQRVSTRWSAAPSPFVRAT